MLAARSAQVFLEMSLAPSLARRRRFLVVGAAAVLSTVARIFLPSAARVVFAAFSRTRATSSLRAEAKEDADLEASWETIALKAEVSILRESDAIIEGGGRIWRVGGR